MRYLDGDTRREIDEAKGQGVPVPRIAERLHMDVRELCELMHWPQWQEIPAAETAADGFDLWSSDRLAAQL